MCGIHLIVETILVIDDEQNTSSSDNHNGIKSSSSSHKESTVDSINDDVLGLLSLSSSIKIQPWLYRRGPDHVGTYIGIYNDRNDNPIYEMKKEQMHDDHNHDDHNLKSNTTTIMDEHHHSNSKWKKIRS